MAKITIKPAKSVRGEVCNSRGDHRVAMALIVAGLAANEEIVVENTRIQLV